MTLDVGIKSKIWHRKKFQEKIKTGALKIIIFLIFLLHFDMFCTDNLLILYSCRSFFSYSFVFESVNRFSVSTFCYCFGVEGRVTDGNRRLKLKPLSS